MALDFPSSPSVGQVFTTGGVTWTWDGVKWVASGTGVGLYLPLSGGVMSGDLILNRDAQVPLGAATLEQVNARGAGDNRVINGDMRINQRGVVSGTISGFTADRWGWGGSPTGKGTWQCNAGGAVAVAATGGFGYFLTFTSSSAYAAAAADFFDFYQGIEADTVSDFAWGTASAQPVTLSFWVYASLTGTFSGAIKNYAGTRSYPFTYLVPSANVWTKLVVTIPGDTAGSWVPYGNAGSMYLIFDLGSGANGRGPAGAWATTTGQGWAGATGSVSIVAVNGASWNVTGVKLEIGTVATPFNRQSLAKSMADCQRYFFWLPINMRFNATTGSQVMQAVSFPAMRASPTIGAQVADPNLTPGAANVTSVGIGNITPYSVGMQLTPITVGDSYTYGYRASAAAEL
jgi:hypothetical protein